jgi:NADH-quinone oxidoreductase subunit J
MVLFLFVIWLLNLQTDAALGGRFWLKFVGAIGAAILAVLLSVSFLAGHAPAADAALPADYGSIASLARLLFSDYLVAFEVTSILLLAAVVGAIGLARRIPAADVSRVADRDAHENFRSAAG